MKTTEESPPTTGSKIIRVRPGSARVAFTYRRQRSLSMSTEIEQGPVFHMANMQQMDGPSSATSIAAAPSSISPKNRVAKLRQLFDQSSTPETDRSAKDDRGSSVVQADNTTPTSADSGKQRCIEKGENFLVKRRKESKFIGFALVFFSSNHKIQLFSIAEPELFLSTFLLSVVSTLQIKQTITVRTVTAISHKPVSPSNPFTNSDLLSRPVSDSHRPVTAYRTVNIQAFVSFEL